MIPRSVFLVLFVLSTCTTINFTAHAFSPVPTPISTKLNHHGRIVSLYHDQNSITCHSSTSNDDTPTTEISSSSSAASGGGKGGYDMSTILKATTTLTQFDQAQQAYIAQNPIGLGGGTSALTFVQTQLTSQDKQQMKESIHILVNQANYERSMNQSHGRVMLGICASNVAEGLMGLKTWIPTLTLPKGLLHGMDVDGKPIDPEELGSVYIKYNTGGTMTFSDMRKSGLGFDGLWRPGDAVLEMYDGDFRGVYFNVELMDGAFRQFGVLPTDLFLEEEEW